jgi:shikimate dehydrogenase
MLIHQGARALEIWTGGPVPVEAMRSAATAALGR